MTSFATIPLAKIRIHPDNVRRDAAADDELIESIRSQGILQAVGVVESGDEYLLIAGHRRLDGATQAGLTAVPAMVLDHLTTRAQQIEAMLVENGRRVDLTAIEEAEAYEQLTLEGYKPKDIAKATGRAVATVQARLALRKLSPEAQSGVHGHQITLEDAAALADLQDFPEILARVEKTIGTNNFKATLAGVRWDVEKQTKHRATRQTFIDAGLTLIEQPEDGWNYETGPCPYRGELEDGVADAFYEGGEYHGPSLAVTVKEATPEDAAADAERQQRDSEWEKKRAERAAAAAAAAAAREIRIAHIRSLFTTTKLPAKTIELTALSLGVGAVTDSQDVLDTYIGGVTRTQQASWLADWDVAGHVCSLRGNALVSALGGRVASELEELAHANHRATKSAQAALDYFDLLTGTGHVLSDVEVELVASIKENLVDLQAEDDES